MEAQPGGGRVIRLVAEGLDPISLPGLVAGNSIPTSSPNDFSHLIDLKTGTEIPKAALQQEKHVLKQCAKQIF